jgi:hypothetical protein
LVSCTQEAPPFEETRAGFGPATPVGYTNIRERAGGAEASGLPFSSDVFLRY